MLSGIFCVGHDIVYSHVLLEGIDDDGSKSNIGYLHILKLPFLMNPTPFSGGEESFSIRVQIHIGEALIPGYSAGRPT